MKRSPKLFHGEIFYFIASPLDRKDSYCYYPNGALVVDNGKIVEVGPYKNIRSLYPDMMEIDYTDRLIMPGFIDAHVHFPQSGIIGMYGKQLIDWLNEYTFPAEEAFTSVEYAEQIARFFINELLKNGTTSCMAYSTVHPISASTLFSVATEYNMCMMTGKILMNQNAPADLLDTTQKGEEDTRALIETWQGQGRNHYVITPRFAITSTMEQLKSAARLHKLYPDTYIQTHLSENMDEISSVLSIHPNHKDYLDVYERVGLLTDRTVFGHCVHLSENEFSRLAEAEAIVAHCPTSNLFLGSGLFDMKQANLFSVKTVLGTDVGAGTSFSMLKTMGEAYKIQQLRGYPMTVFESFYKSTLGTAKALKLDHQIGSFKPGLDADFIVIDYMSTATQKLRMEYLLNVDKWTLENKLFGLQTLGDDRAITATYIMGNEIKTKG